MRKVFEDDDTEAILLAAAENAFNKLNRKVALQNVKQMVIADYTKHDYISSNEGCT